MDRKDEEEIMEDAKVKVTEPVNEQTMVLIARELKDRKEQQ